MGKTGLNNTLNLTFLHLLFIGCSSISSTLSLSLSLSLSPSLHPSLPPSPSLLSPSLHAPFIYFTFGCSAAVCMVSCLRHGDGERDLADSFVCLPFAPPFLFASLPPLLRWDGGKKRWCFTRQFDTSSSYCVPILFSLLLSLSYSSSFLCF